MDEKTIQHNFTHHPPKGDQVSRYTLIRGSARACAGTVNRCAPDSREKSLAMTKLEEAVMWANAAIARNEQGESAFLDDPEESLRELIRGIDNLLAQYPELTSEAKRLIKGMDPE